MDVKIRKVGQQRYSCKAGTGTIASELDYAECRRVMLAASHNYSFASLFFPHWCKKHVEALYALVRIGDDFVDVAHDRFRSPLEAIEAWQSTYEQAFECGYSNHPVMRSYLDTATRFQIPMGVMAPYFRAMKEDLEVSRFATFEDLLRYVEGSAVPVGRAMTYILGVRQPYRIADALPGADCLAAAMQLSNFWRDVGEDWALRRRIYIPLEDMARFNYTEKDLHEQRINNNFVELLEYQFERTEQFYRSARSSVSLLASGQWAIMLGLEVYGAILRTIRSNRYDVFTKRARPTLTHRLALVLKARMLTL